MARKKHGVEEIIGKLREAEVELGRGRTVVDVCRQLGVSEQTYFRWRQEYGGLKLDQARRLKELERENGRLKRAVAELPPGPAMYWPLTAHGVSPTIRQLSNPGTNCASGELYCLVLVRS